MLKFRDLDLGRLLTLDKEVKSWKLSASEVRIRTPDPDHILLVGGLRSLTAHVYGCSTVVVFGGLAAAIAFLAATVPGPITQVSIYSNVVRKHCYSTVTSTREDVLYNNITSIVTSDELTS